jgi:transposase
VVVMDNLSVHKDARVRELIEGRGCELMYLPSYSPDLNLHEEAFSKVKASLRRAGACTTAKPSYSMRWGRRSTR